MVNKAQVGKVACSENSFSFCGLFPKKTST